MSVHVGCEADRPGDWFCIVPRGLTFGHVMLDHAHHSLGISKVPNSDDSHVLWAVPALIEGKHLGGRNALNDVFLAYREPFCILQAED